MTVLDSPRALVTRDYPQLLTNDTRALRRGWHPVCLVGDLSAQPLPVTLLGEHYVLWRTPEGVATNPPVAATAEHLGQVWLAPETPAAGLLPAPEFDDPAFCVGWLSVATTNAAAGLIVDNQLDVSHFPFVHTGTFGDPEDGFVPPYAIERTEGGFTATVEHGFRNVQDPGVLRGERPVEQTRRVTYTFALPMQLHLRIDHLSTGINTTILFGLHPVDEATTRFTTVICRNDYPDDPGGAARSMPAVLEFEQRVINEDLQLQAKFDVRGLPLAPGLELPIRADACGLELRRQLRELCCEYGAA